jgi:hypothetical protein
VEGNGRIYPNICLKAFTELAKEELVMIFDAVAENRIPGTTP